MVQKVYKKLRKAYPDGKEIILIEDNASYNRAYATQNKARKLNITPKFLPPYCPNLNLIERVWKFMKKVMKNIYYPTFEDFLIAVNDFCKNFRNYKDEIKKLLSQKFQIIKAV